jgi:uncharacterized lipoprotein YddW (UPF0748 family)
MTFECKLRSCLAALALFSFSNTTHAAEPEYRAFWVDAFHAGFLNTNQVVTLLGIPGTSQGGVLRDANCNAVIVQARKRFDVCYPSGVGEPYMSGLSPNNFNGLAALIKAAHDTTGGKQRVEVHCWSVAFKTGKGQVYSQHIGTPTGSLTSFDNYWPTRIGSTTGAETGDGAFDPGHPKALEYLVNAHMDLVNFQTTAGLDGNDGHIDGIHYDYIRFEGNTEGFNPTSVARYNARYGLSGDPSSGSEQFKQWRRDQVTAFVRQMYARIQKTKPWIKQSGSFVTWNPSPTSSTRSGFQATRPYYDVYSDWDSWMQEGLMDISVPMTYYNWASLPNDYVRWMNYQKDRKGNRHVIVGPGVYLNSLDNAILELLMTRDTSPNGNRAQGFSGYSYFAPYTTGGTAYGTWAGFAPRFKAEVTPTKTDIPLMPWKTNPTTGHLMGNVVLAENGRWADHTFVSISGPVSKTQYVDGTGFYAFIDLPPGAYNITASLPGYVAALTNVAISAGSAETRNMALSLYGPPVVSVQPQSRTVYEGAPATFAANASGTEPLRYQWRLNGNPIQNATNTLYSLTAAYETNAGAYDFVVTNTYGKATSDVATLTVIVPQVSDRFIPHWSLAPGSRPYLTSGVDQRGMAYNPVTSRLLIVNKTEPSVHVLDADSGNDLHTLDTTGITGGYNSSFYLLMIGVADDGAVYAGNLALNAASTPFKLYRWASDSPAVEPTVAYAGDPLPGTALRWGDTLDVRGAGTNTQIIIGSRSGKHAVIFTTTDGVTFTANPVNVSAAANGAFGLGIAFGEGNTFWGKATGQPLTLNSFNLGSGTGTVLRSEQLSGNISAIGVSQGSKFLAGISIATPDNLQLYDMLSNQVSLVATNPFATDNDNSNLTGSVDFAPGKVFALDSGNGLLAMRYLPPPEPPVITEEPEDQIAGLGGEVELRIMAVGTAPLMYQWRFHGTNLPAATNLAHTITNAQLAHQGPYSVVVTNMAGSVTSHTAMVTIIPPPTFGYHPASKSVVRGDSVLFEASPGVEDPSITWQWLHEGTEIPGANGPQYSFDDAQTLHEGAYQVVLSNLGGSATSEVAVLTVLLPPEITQQPQSRTNLAGSELLLSIVASGSNPLAYQWHLNGTPLPAATTAGYSKMPVMNTDQGTYFVIVTNTAGSATSFFANVTVIYPADPAIASLKHEDNSIQFQLSGGPGQFVLEASPDLLVWTNQATLNIDSSDYTFSQPTTNEPRLYYRLKREP